MIQMMHLMDGRNSVEKAKRDAVRALASAVLEMAKSDWKYYEDNKEVESFLQCDLVDFYLNLADIDKGSYLAEVRSQRLRWRRPKKAGVSNYEAQEIKAET